MLRLLPVIALDQRFEALYAIYCESISPREQKSKVDLAAMVSKSSYRLWLAQDDSNAVGFSIVFVASGELFGLLEYIAVDKSYRGGGVVQSYSRQPSARCMDSMALSRCW